MSLALRRHDRYVLKAYWATFGAALLFLTVVVMVLDLSDRLARITRYWESIEAAGFSPGWTVVKYYATLVPFLWLEVLPFCAPLAAVFCLARLQRHNELTALLTTGVSMRRITLPIVFSALVLAGVMLASEAWLVPTLSRQHMTYGRILGRAKPNRLTHAPHFHDPCGGRLIMTAYLPFDGSIDEARIAFWRDGRLAEIQQYPKLVWDEAQRKWLAPAGGERIPISAGAPGAFRERIPEGSVSPLRASLTLLETSLMLTGSMGLSFEEVRELRRANPTSPRFMLMQQKLLTVPFSAVVLLLCGLPFAFRIRPGSGSAIPGAIGALVVGALFFGMTYLMSSMAVAGDLNPVVLAWLPIVVFGSLGIALYVGLDG